MRRRTLIVLIFVVIFAIQGMAQVAEKNHPGLHPVRDTKGKWGFIDRSGRFRIPPKYAGAEEFSDGVAYVFYWEGQKRMNGVVDAKGNFTILETNDYPVSFHDGLAKFQNSGAGERKFGYMDRSGRVVIQPQFWDSGDFSEGRAWIEVLREHQWLYGFIDKTGAVVVPLQFTEKPSDFKDGVAKAEGRNGWGFIDRAGKFVIPAKFLQVDRSFSEGLVAAVSQGDSPVGVYLDRSGRVAFEIPLWRQRTAKQQAMEEFRWHINASFSEGLAPVLSFNKVGFINKEGKVVIEPLFRGAQSFSEGLAGVRIIGSDGNYVWGYIDRTGRFAIEARFNEVQEFAGGLARVVTVDDRRQLIDSSGKVVWELPK